MSTENTTQHKVTVYASWLFAPRQFAAKKDLRHYLNGVAISKGHIVGTDGGALGAIRHEWLDGLPELIIPNEVIDNVQKLLKANKSLYHGTEITISWEKPEKGNVCDCVMESKGFRQEFKSLDGTYPDFTKVLVTNHTTPYGNPQFNPAYLVAFNKAAGLLQIGSSVWRAYIVPRGDQEGARVLVPEFPRFDGVIMPLKSDRLCEQHPVCVELDKLLGSMKARLVKDCEADAASWGKPGCISPAWLAEKVQAYLDASNEVTRNDQTLEEEVVA